MSMQTVRCPHCGKGVTRAINDSVKMSVNHVVCSGCHKSYTWTADKGVVRTSK